MEKIFDIAKDSEQSWGTLADAIDRNFDEASTGIQTAAQKDELVQVRSDLSVTTDKLTELEEETSPKESKCDFAISDAEGYDIVRFEGGDVKTKNFDSKQTPKTDEYDNDFSIADENDFSIFRVKNGYPYTKNFNGKEISEKINPKIGIVCVGSSSIQRMGLDYIVGGYKLNLLLNRDVKWLGVGGESIIPICARIGSETMVVNANFTIPSNTDSVLIGGASAIKVRGKNISLTTQMGDNLPCLNPVYIEGIKGEISISNGDYYFKREDVGVAKNIKVGDHIISQNAKERDKIGVCALGYNGGYTDVDDYINFHKRVAQFYGGKFIFMSRLNGFQNDSTNWVVDNDAIKAEENALMENFGSNVFNIRQFLVNHAMDMAIAEGLLSSSDYPTAQDLQDMANGCVPTTLRADSKHLTNVGYKVVSIELSKIINTLFL